jgi:hypothetical protein
MYFCVRALVCTVIRRTVLGCSISNTEQRFRWMPAVALSLNGRAFSINFRGGEVLQSPINTMINEKSMLQDNKDQPFCF